MGTRKLFYIIFNQFSNYLNTPVEKNTVPYLLKLLNIPENIVELYC